MGTTFNEAITIKNRKAYFDYTFLSTFTAGIVLTGTEIKSIRQGKASLVDTFCYIHNNEIWMKNSFVSTYDKKGYINHDERRDRKLLLTRKEINKLEADSKDPGYTIVPIRMFITRGLCKVELALCKGKKVYDKRETIKENDAKREMSRVLKNY